MERRIKVLVIPALFKRWDNDIMGTFVEDSLRSMESFAKVIVFFPRLFSGYSKGLLIENTDYYKLYRYTVTNRKPGKLLKFALYPYWFFNTILIGRRFKDIDIIHVHGGVLIYGTIGLLLGKILHRPVFFTEYLNPFSQLMENLFSRIWSRFVFPRFDHVIAISNDLKQQIISNNLVNTDISVSYLPINMNLFNLPMTEMKKHDNLVFVGRFDEYKGALRTIKAFSEISEKNNGWTLTMVGEGEEMAAIVKFLDDNPIIKERIIIKGQRSREEIKEELIRSKVFVFPTRSETFGVVIGEAMACGLPVIVGNRTAPPEFVTDYCGILIDPDNIEELSSAMSYLIQNYSMYDPQVISDHVRKRFHFDSFGNGLKHIYIKNNQKCAELLGS